MWAALTKWVKSRCDRFWDMRHSKKAHTLQFNRIFESSLYLKRWKSYGQLKYSRAVEVDEALWSSYHNFRFVPEHADWGLYFPEATGSRQSPIDLVSCDARYEDILANTPLQFNYATSRETDILNNGYTLVVFPRAKQGKPPTLLLSYIYLCSVSVLWLAVVLWCTETYAN